MKKENLKKITKKEILKKKNNEICNEHFIKKNSKNLLIFYLDFFLNIWNIFN